MIRVLVAPDKFKGSATAAAVADAIASGILDSLPGAQVRKLPLADGGNGTAAALRSFGYKPMGVGACVSRAAGVVLVELAASTQSATGTVSSPLASSSFEFGRVVRAAVESRLQAVDLAVGGSRSTDGGIGLLRALGADVVDSRGRSVPPGLEGLLIARQLQLRSLPEVVANSQFRLIADVRSPLLGPTGAARMFGPQKGLDARMVEVAELAMERWADIVESEVGREERDASGAGAAGGVGFAALAVLNATSRNGAEYVLDAVDFRKYAASCDRVVTGEGSLDRQSALGKVPVVVAHASRNVPVPVTAVVGRTCLDRTELRSLGFSECVSLVQHFGSERLAIREALAGLRAVSASASSRW